MIVILVRETMVKVLKSTLCMRMDKDTEVESVLVRELTNGSICDAAIHLPSPFRPRPPPPPLEGRPNSECPHTEGAGPLACYQEGWISAVVTAGNRVDTMLERCLASLGWRPGEGVSRFDVWASGCSWIGCKDALEDDNMRFRKHVHFSLAVALGHTSLPWCV